MMITSRQSFIVSRVVDLLFPRNTLRASPPAINPSEGSFSSMQCQWVARAVDGIRRVVGSRNGGTRFREIGSRLPIEDGARIMVGWPDNCSGSPSTCYPDTRLPRGLSRSSLEALLEDVGFPVIQIQNHLPEEAVCPREPKVRQRHSCQQCHSSPVHDSFFGGVLWGGGGSATYHCLVQSLWLNELMLS